MFIFAVEGVLTIDDLFCRGWNYQTLKSSNSCSDLTWFDYPSSTSLVLGGFLLRTGNRVQPTLVYEMNLTFPKVKQPVLSTRSSNNPEFGNDEPRLSHWNPCMVEVSAWYIGQCKEARDRQALWGGYPPKTSNSYSTCQQTHSKINGAL